MSKAEMKIDGMSCGHCVTAVQSALESVSGISVTKVEIGHATVEYQDASALEAAKEAVSEEGYDVLEVTA